MKDSNVYLLAHYTARPKDPSRTKESGYMSNPENVAYDERVEFTVGLKPKHRQGAGVIINLSTQEVVFNRFNAEAEFDDVVKYYIEAYPEYMEKLGYTLVTAEEEDGVDVQPVQTEEETQG
jgi:hypothetical protein